MPRFHKKTHKKGEILLKKTLTKNNIPTKSHLKKASAWESTSVRNYQPRKVAAQEIADQSHQLFIN